MAYFRKRNPDRPEVIDLTDLQLTAQEASAVAEVADKWPGGLGEALVPCETSRRGWKRDPSYDVFNKDYVPGGEVLLCPVMVVKKIRHQSNLYHLHLSAWRSLRNAYAEMLNLSLKEAHSRYNEDLRSQPKEMAKVFRRYAARRQAMSGTKSISWYVLYELVDDFGNYITPPEVQRLAAYESRYWFFCETDTLGEEDPGMT